MIIEQPRINERSETIFQYHQAHPEISCRKLGKIFGVSGQRISNILRTQTRKTQIMRRDQVIYQYAEKYSQHGEYVGGEVFVLTQPRHYYRIQQELRNMAFLKALG